MKHITNKNLYEILQATLVEVQTLKKQIKENNRGINSKVFFSYTEVAELLCVSIEAVRTKVKRGVLERVCSDNTPLIAKMEIIRYLRSQNPNWKGFD